jgi:hypothetical protein
VAKKRGTPFFGLLFHNSLNCGSEKSITVSISTGAIRPFSDANAGATGGSGDCEPVEPVERQPENMKTIQRTTIINGSRSTFPSVNSMVATPSIIIYYPCAVSTIAFFSSKAKTAALKRYQAILNVEGINYTFRKKNDT